MKPKKVRLFIKTACPWCDEAIEWLNRRRVKYDVLNVSADPVARRMMFDLSQQTYAPTIDVDGEILADFGADELEAWWNQHGFSKE